MATARTPLASIGMGEMRVSKAPDVLQIRGLGSCIALALHDPLQRLAGLAHVVIPRPLPNTPPAPAWAATQAVPALLAAMKSQGGRESRIVARLAGGSSLFPGMAKGFEVGRENADAVEALLREHGIPVLSRQVGGHASRNVRLHAVDGRLEVDALALRAAPPRREPQPDPTEAARVVIEAAAAPLSNLLQRPIVVEPSGRHDLGAGEVIAFLGPRTRMRWSRLAYTGLKEAAEIHLVIPDLHARRIDEELRARLAEPGHEGGAIDEVLNIMLTHVLSALAKASGNTLRPEGVVAGAGATPQLARSLRPQEDGLVRVVHARLHMQDAFRGIDLAILGQGLP